MNPYFLLRLHAVRWHTRETKNTVKFQLIIFSHETYAMQAVTTRMLTSVVYWIIDMWSFHFYLNRKCFLFGFCFFEFFRSAELIHWNRKGKPAALDFILFYSFIYVDFIQTCSPLFTQRPLLLLCFTFNLINNYWMAIADKPKTGSDLWMRGKKPTPFQLPKIQKIDDMKIKRI